MKKIFFLPLLLSASALFAQDTIKKPEFKPSGKVWGYAFGDYYFKLHADSSGRGGQQYSGMPESTNAFEFRRIYLGYDYNISEKFSTEFLLSYEGTTLSDNATRTVFIKAANVRWKNVLPNTDLVFGQQATPCFPPTMEKVWGYRSIEKTVSDMRKVCTSNDLGIGLQTKFDSKGNYGANLLVGNGTSQKLENDRFKRMYGELYAKFMDQHILVDLYGDYERLQLDPYHKSKMTMKASVGYISDVFTAGVELFQQTQENNVIATDTAMQSDSVNVVVAGLSVYVRGMIIKDKLNYFARFDAYDPDTKYNPDLSYNNASIANKEIFITAGVDYMPVKNVHIMPNVWYNSYSSRMKNVKGLAKNDNDLVLRLTLYYIFK